MADKTTTLKTKTNDNVYPNVIGDNRKNAFVDSSTITHHFYDQTHKVGFQIANETNIKIQNSLQKPTGLTKTKLVGVGTNGQENIEIGDNLILANGKLSAMGGGEGTLIVNLSECLSDTDFNDFVLNVFNKKSISKIYDFTNNTIKTTGINNIELNVNYSGLIIKFYFRRVITNYGIFFVCEFTWTDNPKNQTIMYLNCGFMQDTLSQLKLMIFTDYYSHFITLTNSTSTFYFTYQNTLKDNLDTLDSLKTALTGKSLLCTGHTDSDTAEYISGEGANIVVGVVDKSDNSTSGITIDSSVTITDLVTIVE